LAAASGLGDLVAVNEKIEPFECIAERRGNDDAGERGVGANSGRGEGVGCHKGSQKRLRHNPRPHARAGIGGG
jgi:hypothetical protein